MIVGLPGTGIGGLFYLLNALLMPFVQLWRAVRSRTGPPRWREVARLAGLAAAIFFGLWATAWVLDLVLPAPATVVNGGGSVGESASRSLGVTASYVTFATLAVVVILVEFLAVLFGARPRRARPAEG
jgi:hypothetical protein